MKPRGPVFGILHAVRRHRDPRSGLLYQNNEESFSNYPAPTPATGPLQAIPSPRDRGTGLVLRVAWVRGGCYRDNFTTRLTLSLLQLLAVYLTEPGFRNDGRIIKNGWFSNIVAFFECLLYQVAWQWLSWVVTRQTSEYMAWKRTVTHWQLYRQQFSVSHCPFLAHVACFYGTKQFIVYFRHEFRNIENISLNTKENKEEEEED